MSGSDKIDKKKHANISELYIQTAKSCVNFVACVRCIVCIVNGWYEALSV